MSLRMAIANIQNQSISTLSPVEIAARNHKTWFTIYVIWVVIAAIVSAFLTFMLWRAGNRQQDAVVSATDERTATLEHETEGLKIVVADTEKKRIEAEHSLLELQQQLAHRSISSEQSSKFIAFLKDAPKGKVKLTALLQGDNEPINFAQKLKDLLSKAGYTVDETIGGFMSSGAPVSGIVIKVDDTKSPPPHAGPIQKAFEQINIAAPGALQPPTFKLGDESVLIYVYGKP